MTAPSAAAPEPRTQLIAAAALVVTSFLWGSMVPLTAIALASYDVYLLSAVRYTIGTTILTTMMLLADRRMPRLRALPWRRIVACGIAAGLFVTLATISIQHSDPITISALFAAAPLIAVLMARMEQHAKLSRPVIVGIVAAVGGGVLVALGQAGDPGASADAGLLERLDLRGGEILIMVAMAIWTWYSLKTQQWLAPIGLSQLQITVLTLVCASVLLWLVYGAMLALGVIQPTLRIPPWTETAAMLWLAVGPTATAVALWNYGNAKVGVTIATLMINLAPVFSVLIAMGFGYLPTPLQIIGGGVVLAGVLWMQFALMQRRPAPTTAP